MVFSFCKCCQHMGRNAAGTFFNDHFIPMGWELVYSKLSECGCIILKGRCKSCYGDLDELIEIPENLIGDDLLQAIYLRLYEQVKELTANAQNDGERQKIQTCLDQLEDYSRKAHEAIHFSYAPLPELYELRAS